MFARRTKKGRAFLAQAVHAEARWHKVYWHFRAAASHSALCGLRLGMAAEWEEGNGKTDEKNEAAEVG